MASEKEGSDVERENDWMTLDTGVRQTLKHCSECQKPETAAEHRAVSS